jgi:hypothetical protein
MPPELTTEAWTQIRHDYEHTDRPIGDICDEHGISSGTLRDRMRRWGWTRRRSPIPFEGPPAATQPDMPLPAERAFDPEALPGAASPGEPGEPSPPDDRPIAERLRDAVACVLPSIEGTLATLARGPVHPRELERTSRALAALTRTLRELSTLMAEHNTAPVCDCGGPVTPERLDEMRHELARKLEAFVASCADADAREAARQQ